MNLARKVALTLVATVIAVGVSAVPAQADSSWHFRIGHHAGR